MHFRFLERYTDEDMSQNGSRSASFFLEVSVVFLKNFLDIMAYEYNIYVKINK